MIARPLRQSRARRQRILGVVAFWLVVGFTSGSAAAGERYALIVSGASGGEKYTQSYDRWRNTLMGALREKLAFETDRVISLWEAGEGQSKATRENVRSAVTALKERTNADDLLLVVLIGHGSYDGESAKFNLVGPDLEAREWSDLFESFAGTLVFVNTAGASFPYLQEFSGRGRIVVTATDSPAQRYDTVFAEFFIGALDQMAADLDKNGRISIWEAFSSASIAVQRSYEQRGQLATERPLLDDNGDGVGKEVEAPGPDGAVARSTFLDPEPAIGGPDAVLVNLQRRRDAILAEMEELKGRKGQLTRDQFDAEFEKLAIELARISRVIRSRS